MSFTSYHYLLNKFQFQIYCGEFWNNFFLSTKKSGKIDEHEKNIDNNQIVQYHRDEKWVIPFVCIFFFLQQKLKMIFLSFLFDLCNLQNFNFKYIKFKNHLRIHQFCRLCTWQLSLKKLSIITVIVKINLLPGAQKFPLYLIKSAVMLQRNEIIDNKNFFLSANKKEYNCKWLID